MIRFFFLLCGGSSVGRASASQAEGRGFKSRPPLFVIDGYMCWVLL